MRSTSPPKSAWPGVSTILMRVPSHSTLVHLARMVMPRSRSRSLESMRALGHVLVLAHRTGLLQQLVDQRRLAMVDMGDDGDIADIHWACALETLAYRGRIRQEQPAGNLANCDGFEVPRRVEAINRHNGANRSRKTRLRLQRRCGRYNVGSVLFVRHRMANALMMSDNGKHERRARHNHALELATAANYRSNFQALSAGRKSRTMEKSQACRSHEKRAVTRKNCCETSQLAASVLRDRRPGPACTAP